MHEFAEMQAMLQQALAQCPQGTRIVRLRIAVGEASGHDPRHIEMHFRQAARGTMAEGAELEFAHESLAARCAGCGAEYGAAEFRLSCPECGGTRLVITAGQQVYLAGVEMDCTTATPD